MIRIAATLADGHFSLAVDGHEGRVEDGRVCAAVSALTQTTLLGLEQIAHAHPDIVSIEITTEK
ncbi:MAG TPA: ribosomal-processing cysteine protease Prp [Kutzneria sp.]|nr:ribosomal-processing cysteine protease Prp [Kutzneria sp.]